MNEPQSRPNEPTSLHDKIRHVLTEARMVLPGAQALLGFQFVTLLMGDFDRLPASSKYVHLASLLSIALSTILLMTPAAHHRVVEKGENTEAFHRFASRFVLAALIPLALGVCGDFFVVARKATGSLAISFSVTASLFCVFFGLWFGLTLHRRIRMRKSALQVEPWVSLDQDSRQGER